MSTFNITHSRSEIEWSGLMKCLAIGNILLLSWILLCDYSSSLMMVDVSPDVDV